MDFVKVRFAKRVRITAVEFWKLSRGSVSSLIQADRSASISCKNLLCFLGFVLLNSMFLGVIVLISFGNMWVFLVGIDELEISLVLYVISGSSLNLFIDPISIFLLSECDFLIFAAAFSSPTYFLDFGLIFGIFSVESETTLGLNCFRNPVASGE